VIAPRGVAEADVSAVRSAVLADYEDRMHALSSGLAAVSGAVQLLAAPPDELGPVMGQRLGAMLVEEMQRLQRLASASDLSASEYQPVAEMDLDEVVRSVVLTRGLADQQVDWEESGYRIRGRQDVVVELLQILLVNASRHAPGSTARIEATREGSMIRVSVTDSGPGVPEQLRNVIFERGAHREDSEGQGLGLSIARRLARGLGGTLELVPDVPAGARFDLTLPQGDLGGAA
jgi:signal transduction histidine kinase